MYCVADCASWPLGIVFDAFFSGDTFNDMLKKYNPENNNMFFVTTKGENVYSDVNYSNLEDIFLLFGKETKGLPEDILKKYIQKTIRIPMRESLRSLNLSNAVAIVAYDVFRQKNFEGLQEVSEYFHNA